MRPKGTPNIEFGQIDIIMEMSQKKEFSRGEIADAVGCSKKTVWKYQSMFNLI